MVMKLAAKIKSIYRVLVEINIVASTNKIVQLHGFDNEVYVLEL